MEDEQYMEWGVLHYVEGKRKAFGYYNTEKEAINICNTP